jgi:hypothetical protein
MEATAAINPDICPKTDHAQPFLVVFIFSCIGLAISLLAARHGLEVDPGVL